MEVRREEGFTLIEVMVAISVVAIVLAATTSWLVTATRTTNHQRMTQAAARVVTQHSDALHDLGPAQLFDQAGTATISDGSAEFVVTTVVDDCFAVVPNADDPSVNFDDGISACLTGAGAAPEHSVHYFMVSITAKWDDPTCESTCSYSETIVMNGDVDPVFPSNAGAPPKPKLSDCRDQHLVVGQRIALDLRDARLGCVVTDGVKPFMWSVTPLPGGLELTPDGGISGDLTGPVGALSTQVTVTDAFLRESSMTMTWSVTDPGELIDRSLWLDADSTQAVHISLADFFGDDSGAATYELTGGALPSGLSVDTGPGFVTGSPADPDVGDYSVTISASGMGGPPHARTFVYYVRAAPNIEMLLCPTSTLPYDPPVQVHPDPPVCSIPGFYDPEQSYSSTVAELQVGVPMAPFSLWDSTYGGTSPYTFALGPGAPAWVHLDVSTGVVTGTPTEITPDDLINVTFSVTDASGGTPVTASAHWRVIQ